MKHILEYLERTTAQKPDKTAVIDGERSVFCGWKKGQFTWQNLIINYELFLEYREEILIMRECLMLIRNLTKNEMTI